MTPPTKQVYAIGEELNLMGAEATIRKVSLLSGSSYIVNQLSIANGDLDVDISAYNAEKEGTYTIAVRTLKQYGGQYLEASFEVTVKQSASHTETATGITTTTTTTTTVSSTQITQVTATQPNTETGITTTTTTTAASTVTEPVSTPEPGTSTTTDTKPVTSPTVSGTGFDRKNDGWGFQKNGAHLNDGKGHYYLEEADKELLFSQLSHIERQRIEKILSEPSTGSCYGMSVASILYTMGLFDLPDGMKPSDVIVNLYDKNRTTLTPEIASKINYYQLIQFTKAVEQRRYRFAYDIAQGIFLGPANAFSEQTKLEKLVKEVESGRPTLLCYTYRTDTNKLIGHAVVAYAIEKNPLTSVLIDDDYYNFEYVIRVYDSRVQSMKDDRMYDMYINLKDGKWLVKATNDEDCSDVCIMNDSGYHSGSIGLIASDVEFLNYLGMENGTKTLPSPEDNGYFAQWEMNTEWKTGKDKPGSWGLFAVESSGNGFNAATNEPFNVQVADFCADGAIEPNREKYLLDANCGWQLSATTAIPLNVSMEYKEYLLDADIKGASSLTVMPEGGIYADGMQGKYTFSVVSDTNMLKTNWYQIQVKGNSSSSLSIVPDKDLGGWVISGEEGQLRSLTITVNNEKEAKEKTISARGSSILVTMDENGEIAVYEDSNNFGNYDILLTDIMGDVNFDGKVTADDSNIVLLAYLEQTVMHKELPLTEREFAVADMNGDKMITADDSSAILQLYLNDIMSK